MLTSGSKLHNNNIHTIHKFWHPGKMRRTKPAGNTFDDRQAENLADFHKNGATVFES